MDSLPSRFLEDPGFTVPQCRPAARGMAWLRGQVPRFIEGPEHDRRRALLEQTLAELRVAPQPGQDPTLALLAAMTLPAGLAAQVAAAAAGYQPHTATDPGLTAAADDAVERLVTACGGRSERTAMLICILVQACAGMQAVREQRRTGRAGSPIPATRRIGPDGREVLVDLTDVPFGRGTHRCPGRQLAENLSAAEFGERPDLSDRPG